MRHNRILGTCVAAAIATVVASTPAYAGPPRMLVLIDASGSMNTSRNNADGNGATRFEAAKTLSKSRIKTQADNDNTLVVAVYTFHNDTVLIRHTGTSDSDAFVDPNAAKTAINSLTTADVGGSTPLAGSMCVAGNTLHVPNTADVEILQVSSDGEENATPDGTLCHGTLDGTCDVDGNTCTPPGSWQAQVLEHVIGLSAVIVRVDLFNTAPVVGSLASQASPDPEQILDPQSRMRSFAVSASSGLTPLEEFFTVLTRVTGGTLTVARDDKPLPIEGDLNHDFCTDRTDAILVARAFGPVVPPTDNGKYDLNLDRRVDFADYQIQAAQISPTCGPDPYVRRDPVACHGAARVVIDGQVIEDGALTIDARGSCEITIKNSLIVSGKNAIKIVGSAVITVDNSIIVGQDAVITQHGSGVLSAANSVFHGKIDTQGAFQYIDRGGNVFE